MARSKRWISGKSAIKAVKMMKRRWKRKAPGLGRSLISGNPYSFKRSVYITQVNTGTGIGAGTAYGALSPQLNQLANVSEYGALFDSYRINFVVYRIAWRATGISLVETQNNQAIGAPYCIWTLDRDDSTVPTSTNQLREYAKSREHFFSDNKKVLYIKFKPNITAIAYQTALVNSYMPTYNKWIDIGDGGATPYYGIKYALITPNSGSPTSANYFDIEATYYFQMKDPR